VVVGAGFAGVACAKELGSQGVAVTLIDKNTYHQFQPLLYQVATALRDHFRRSAASAMYRSRRA
jgi:NADH dehydrogenase FAD-containing subunit